MKQDRNNIDGKSCFQIGIIEIELGVEISHRNGKQEMPGYSKDGSCNGNRYPYLVGDEVCNVFGGSKPHTDTYGIHYPVKHMRKLAVSPCLFFEEEEFCSFFNRGNRKKGRRKRIIRRS